MNNQNEGSTRDLPTHLVSQNKVQTQVSKKRGLHQIENSSLGSSIKLDDDKSLKENKKGSKRLKLTKMESASQRNPFENVG